MTCSIKECLWTQMLSRINALSRFKCKTKSAIRLYDGTFIFDATHEWRIVNILVRVKLGTRVAEMILASTLCIHARSDACGPAYRRKVAFGLLYEREL